MQNDLLLRFYHELRTELFHTELLLQQTPTKDTAAWAAAINQVQLVLQRCSANIAQTEAQLYPLAEVYEPAVIDTLRQKQRTISAQQFGAAIVALPGAVSFEEQGKVRQNMITAYDGVVLSQMQFLQQLQNTLLPILNRFYAPELLHEIASVIIKKCTGNAPFPEQVQEKLRATDALFRNQVYRAEAELHKAQAIAHETSGWPSLVMHQ